MEDTKIFKVKNRSASRIVYTIPEEGIRREFAPGEVKEIIYRELEKLSYQPGGRNMMSYFLQIESEQATQALNIHTEPEYWMSEENIIEVIRTAPLAQFLDCLDYAPVGAIDLLKRYAVDIPMTDTQKIEALKEKTGFDVLKAIAMSKEDTTTESAAAVEETPVQSGRRTAATYKTEEVEDTTPATPSYKVISQE